MGVNTRIEAENSIEDSVELMLEDFDRLGGKGMNNPTLAKTFAENCGRAVDWLDTVVGVDFGERVPTYGGYVARMCRACIMRSGGWRQSAKSSGKGASGYVKALSAKVDEGIANGNVCLMLDTR